MLKSLLIKHSVCHIRGITLLSPSMCPIKTLSVINPSVFSIRSISFINSFVTPQSFSNPFIYPVRITPLLNLYVCRTNIKAVINSFVVLISKMYLCRYVPLGQLTIHPLFFFLLCPAVKRFHGNKQTLLTIYRVTLWARSDTVFLFVELSLA